MDGVLTYSFHLLRSLPDHTSQHAEFDQEEDLGVVRADRLPPVQHASQFSGGFCPAQRKRPADLALWTVASAGFLKLGRRIHMLYTHSVSTLFVFSGGAMRKKEKIELFLFFFHISPLCAAFNLSLESTEFEARHTRTACGVLGRSLRAYSTSITNYVSTPRILGIPSRQNVLFCTGRSSFSPCSYSCVWWLLCWQDKLTN